jgi:predicted nuclease with TOPRIM domain
MNIQHVVKLLRIANNDLRSVEVQFEKLKREISTEESEKQNLSKIIRIYKDQVTDLGKRFDSSCLSCEQEEDRLNELQKEGFDTITIEGGYSAWKYKGNKIR